MKEQIEGLRLIQDGAKSILIGLSYYIGIDPEDQNFKDTPARVTRAYEEIFEGGKDTDKQIDKILETAKFPGEGYNEMIICKGIKTFSMCPHHLLPVECIIDIGYIPGEQGKVLGLSKVPRIAQVLSKRPVLQEALTKDIGEAMNRVDPKGVAVRVRCVHFCMKMRGVKTDGEVITSFVSGAFMDEEATREEFIKLITTK